MMVKHCFYCNEHVGVLTINGTSLSFTPDKIENVKSEGARNFLTYVDLSSERLIRLFIEERVTPVDRMEDRVLWGSMCGAKPYCSDLELFLAGHGMSGNDCFWIDDKRDSTFWKELINGVESD